MTRGRIIAALWVTLSASVLAQTAQVEIDKLGPQVGERAVPFALPDQFGRVQTLESLAGPKGTMLVFFRSADW